MDCCRVQWCDLLHCGNVILPKAEITPETPILPEGLQGNMRAEGVIFGRGQYDVTTVRSECSYFIPLFSRMTLPWNMT